MKEVVLKNAPVDFENGPNERFWLIDYPILCYISKDKQKLEFIHLSDIDCPIMTIDMKQEGLTFVAFVTQFPKDYDSSINFLCY